jgi:DNA modification methylase
MACIEQIVTEKYAIYNGDSCELLASLPGNSIHLSIYSPPFATDGGGCLYRYTSSPRDLSNCRSYGEFFEAYEFIVSQISRITLPGRISAVHCMDVPSKGANIGGYIDFPGDIIRLYEKHGFEYLPRIQIWKEPLAVRNRTMMKSLTHRQICEDSVQTSVAGADYLIPFRKVGVNPIPVVHPVGLLNYAGEREIPSELHRFRGWKGNQIQNRFSHWIWRNYASCIWDDVRMSRTVQSLFPEEFVISKEDDDEKHMHPLQLDVIERACVMWSNPGENVLTPFMGVGSEVAGAVVNGRRGIGIELKPSYFKSAAKIIAKAAEIGWGEDDGQKTFEEFEVDGHGESVVQGGEPIASTVADELGGI